KRQLCHHPRPRYGNPGAHSHREGPGDGREAHVRRTRLREPWLNNPTPIPVLAPTVKAGAASAAVVAAAKRTRQKAPRHAGPRPEIEARARAKGMVRSPSKKA